ncbi:hypothetical protein JJL56_29360 [Azospirillum sp. YIM DDC1]|uniref:Uncharacterized protein n=1 Tax=Azospirillum aestuarii TaxID=2802052 RepID=A0ABS1I7C3_9PROT|nr:hypothetical protein [Azospirillum aestuarii]MBK3775584.1 hypothetical protein [Azospirillum brasilense]MBK4722971.1 hypothetical protein [Azospirillum aestuarii]
MTEDEFRELLDRHGGDLERWPRATLREARRLLAQSIAAQAMLDEMVAIDLALAETDGEATPPADLADRIFERAFGARTAGAGTASSDALTPDAAPLPGINRPV